MARENEFNVVFERIIGDFRNLHELANEKAEKVLPFGSVDVAPKNVQEHLAKLTVEQRRKLMEDPEKRAQILAAFRQKDNQPVFAPLEQGGS